MKSKLEIYKNISIIEKQKNYEILLIHYYKKTLKEDILLSDEKVIDGYQFRSIVDVDVDSYIITTYYKHPYFDYKMVCEIDNETYQVLKLEYSKEE